MQIKKSIVKNSDKKISRREFAKKAASVCGGAAAGLMSVEKISKAAIKSSSRQKNVLLLIA